MAVCSIAAVFTGIGATASLGQTIVPSSVYTMPYQLLAIDGASPTEP
jgi:hypothetical protein